MLIWLIWLVVILASSEDVTNANTSCIERERQALLSFRSGLVENADRLSSWRSDDKDCCRWIGVHCSHKTGHITKIDLRDLYLGGEIGPSLLNLTSLRYLDLSWNNFFSFPAFIGSLNGLRYLSLSRSFFNVEVVVPPQLGNLSKLEYLHLGDVRVDTLEWISRLSSLRYLQIFGMNVSSVPNSFELITNLPLLVSLRVGSCGISFPSFPFNFNSSKFLEVIDISGEELNSPALLGWLNVSHKLVDLSLSFSGSRLPNSILNFVGTMTSLEHLDLSRNNLQGQISMSLGNLCKLLTFDLSYGSLNGSLNFFQNWTRCTPNHALREFRAIDNQLIGTFDFSNFTSLEVLDISENKFSGILSKSIGKLTNLIDLDVRSNSFEGVISDSHFSNLYKLKFLDLSYNSFELNLNSSWVPPFQLRHLGVSGCKLGPAIPNWIRTQENLVDLDISNSGISDVLPSSLWDLCNRLEFFNISHNHVRGAAPNFSSGQEIDLSNNQFDGPLPWFSSTMWTLNLSKNKFSGNLSFLYIQELHSLSFLDLSSNLLSGNLPDCWMNSRDLNILDLSNNNFEGAIPATMGRLSSLVSLSLNNNNLSGKLPSCFLSQQLISLGLGGNQFSGNIPPWIGNLTKLVFLELQSNKFSGNIPKCMCQMEKIQILDLSLNNLSGNIPTCLDNLTTMAQKTSERTDELIMSWERRRGDLWDYWAISWVTWKGTKVGFQKTLGLLKLIDLSSNKLSGEIPAQLASLYGLISLNLSSNHLTGLIPGRIGQLQQLDSLDLSNNQLSGKIPNSITNITGLSCLDLSNNNLSSRIPSSTQMQSFNATVFAGNPELCGLPLATKCPGDGNSHPPPITNHGRAGSSSQEDKQWFMSPWFSSGFGLGFVIGFCGVCGPLVLYASFRQAYFQFLNKVTESLLLAMALKKAKLKRWVLSWKDNCRSRQS